uniref:Serine/threonine-protein kinase/endoribonuclease IRE1a n=2 Tax=Noccaea caerulescens TaxID=107243 RepID=A0A1J3HQL0_NOCCA
MGDLETTTSSISRKEAAHQVYKGKLLSRKVCFQRRAFSDNGYMSALHELKKHFQSENNSQRILKCYHIEKVSDFIYVSFEPWKCTLGQALRFASTQGNKREGLLPNQVNFLQKNFGNSSVFWQAGEPTPLPVSFVKDMLLSLSDLHRCGILHRNLDEESFFIVKNPDHPNQNGFILKLGNMRLAKSTGDRDVVGEPNFSAPELSDRTRHEGPTNDVYLLGLIIGYALCGGKPLYLQPMQKGSLRHTLEATSLFKQFPEISALVKSLLRVSYSERCSASSAFSHVFFWSNEKKVSFLHFCSSEMSCYSSYDQWIWKPMLTSMKNIVPNGYWIDKLVPTLQADIGKNNPYSDLSSLPNLVRIIKNYLVHYKDNEATIKTTIGHFPETILSYFITVFPMLIPELRFLISGRLKHIGVFLPYLQ